MRNIPKVALLVETSREFGRELLRGIARYAQQHGPWSFYVTPGDFVQEMPKMKQWGGTGIIARVTDASIAKAIVSARLPTIVVGLSSEQKRPDNPLAHFVEIGPDESEIARLAAEHFLDRHFRNFAYVGMEERAWSQPREQAFCSFLREAGYTPHVYRQPKRDRDRDWEREQNILAEWIRTLPKPLALFACNDDRGRQVLEVCQMEELRVPDDVAVLGVDNDDVFCELSNPPLSSIALNAETAGFRAAELLDAMMRGLTQEPTHIPAEVLGVVTRMSTDFIAVNDPDVAAALKFIRRERGNHMSVDDVAESSALSRRTLEKRFRSATGRSILEDIQLVRLERAKQLLLETSLSVSKIATLSGFGSTGYFIQFFQRRAGKTPRKFRNELKS